MWTCVHAVVWLACNHGIFGPLPPEDLRARSMLHVHPPSPPLRIPGEYHKMLTKDKPRECGE